MSTDKSKLENKVKNNLKFPEVGTIFLIGFLILFCAAIAKNMDLRYTLEVIRSEKSGSVLTDKKIFQRNLNNKKEEKLFINPPKVEKSIEKIIYDISKIYNVDPIIIKAIIEQESQYNPVAVKYEESWERKYSHLIKRKPNDTIETWKMNFKSFGLMQVSYVLHKDFCDLDYYSDLFDPNINILCGTKILAKCLEDNDKLTCIKKYNGAGPSAEKYKKEVLTRISRIIKNKEFVKYS